MIGDILALETLLEDYYNLETGKPLKSNPDGFFKSEIVEYMEAKKEYDDKEIKGYTVQA